jgi:hypothetical protein
MERGQEDAVSQRNAHRRNLRAFCRPVNSPTVVGRRLFAVVVM